MFACFDTDLTCKTNLSSRMGMAIDCSEAVVLLFSISMVIFTPIVLGVVCVWFLFCCAVLSVCNHFAGDDRVGCFIFLHLMGLLELCVSVSRCHVYVCSVCDISWSYIFTFS